MIRRNLMSMVGLLTLTVTLAFGGAKPRTPNIVFVLVDQLRADVLSCYGGENIETPNMDRLADEGIRLDNALSTYPICSPYRAMCFTGMYPMRNGMTNNDHPLKPDLPSFAQACNDAGYDTAYIGKWHLYGFGRRQEYIPPEHRLGFGQWQALECTHDYFNSMYYENESQEPKYWPGYDADSQTDAATDFIRGRDKDKPFFLTLSWGPPHDPYIAPKKYMDRVDPAKIKLRANVASSAVADELLENPRFNIPDFVEDYKQQSLATLKDESKIRENLAAYLAATLALDDYLGRLYQALEDEDILNDSLIIFTSDHGDHLGSHRLWGKNTPYEESIHIPFMMRYPKRIAPGLVSDALLEPVDVMPTVLGMVGVKCPKVDGEDRSRVVLGQEQDQREASLIMCMTHLTNTSLINGLDTWRGVRTKRFTYARYEDESPWLLFDNQNDPFQLNNLAQNPESAKIISGLSRTLNGLLEKAGDAEDTKALYDQIIKENPDRELLLRFRAANPDHENM